MIISILLLGSTLISMAVFYYSYQSDFQQVEEEEIVYKKDWEHQIEKAKQEAEDKAWGNYQKELDAYNQRLAEEEKKKIEAKNNGQFYVTQYSRIGLPPREPGIVPGPYTEYSSEFDDRRSEIVSQFETTAIIHIIVFGFTILSEIGLLLVLPKRANHHNINLDIQNRKEQ
jgi:hypothetical protein